MQSDGKDISLVAWSIKTREIFLKCPTCEKHKEVHPEPLRPPTTPDYLFQKLGMDLVEWKGHKLVYWSWAIFQDGLKSLPFRRQNHNKPRNMANRFFSKTQNTRSSFFRTMVNNNMHPVNSHNLQKPTDINLRTSSPRHTQGQGNGEKERAVQKENLSPNWRGNTSAADDFSVAKLCRLATQITPRGTWSYLPAL